MTDDRDIEKLLESVAPAPVPRGLKTKLLTAVHRRRADQGTLPPLLRWCLAGCAVVMVIAIGADAVLGHGERLRLQALLGPSAPPEDRSADFAALGDALGISAAEARILERMLLSGRQAAEKLPRSLWNPTTFLEEDFHGQKN